MADVPAFVARVAELPRILEVLSYHDRVPLELVARAVGRPVEQVREVLRTYYVTDEAPDRVGFAPPLRFVDDAGRDVDPATAPCVALDGDHATDDLAFRYAPVEAWAGAYRAARDRLHLDPGDRVLAAAVEKLGAALDLEGRHADDAGGDDPALWSRAASARHRVRIRYARAWRPGTVERVVDPYRVVRTRRGWEVDAGPPDAEGRLRTYLLSGVLEAEVLAETFERPADVARLLEAQRRTTAVTLVVPVGAVWVVERMAERVEVVRQDDFDAQVTAHLLEPVRDRVALVLAQAGVEAMATDPALADAGRELAARLLVHHRA